MEALSVIDEEKPDLVLVDISLKNSNGLNLLKDISQQHPDVQTLAVSMHDEYTYAVRCLKAGARGFVPKTLTASAFLAAAQQMVAGETYAPSDVVTAEPTEPSLSRRELDVLRGLCEGKANKEIARDLDLQEVTIKLHVKTLSRKLQARNRTHAAMIARDRCLV